MFAHNRTEGAAEINIMRFGALRSIATFTWLGMQLPAMAAPVSVNATAGMAFAGEAVNVALLEIRNDVTAHVAIAAAAGYLDVAAGRGEGQLRLMAIGTWSIPGWTLDNRHMLSLSTQSVERYRMRARVVRPELFGFPTLSARAFDEVFVDLDGAGFIRNNVALGVGFELHRALLAELYRVWEGNHGAPDDRYLLGLVTVRF
jgi:hypothetical protein|nr:hypothetical protein [uncultured Steroidobacter sp.]